MSGRWTAFAGRGPLYLGSASCAPTAGRGRAVFLDRDGVVNEGVPDPESGMPESPLTVEAVRLLPGAGQALRELADAGYPLVCVSNQPAAAKGKIALEELLVVHERVLTLLAREGVAFDVSLLCPHHPDGVVDGLSGPCGCRKPAPGMLLAAAQMRRLDLGSSWILGDTDADIAAGLASGCRTALIEYPGSAHKRSGAESPDLLASDLPAAVAQLLDTAAETSSAERADPRAGRPETKLRDRAR